MTRLRFTLAQLMGIVLFLALGFAALRNANDLWASLTFTVAITAIATAPLVAFTRTGRKRLVWAGFAVFGWAYVVVDLLAPTTIYSATFGVARGPKLMSSQLVDLLQPYIMPSTGFDIAHEHICHSLGIILFGVLGAVVGRLIPLGDDRPAS
jgi:hypothetical protein